ncbi:uncharacterized protein LOC127737320 [Mytilus californianus]|uniref:uncharacterized protein LOC127737320 n=1 Tax=Mytilus californianus TaxID=6549 RepID=UPI0022479675|nr:uncharacterized protein LOC127737320 [Mytilus californianus]
MTYLILFTASLFFVGVFTVFPRILASKHVSAVKRIKHLEEQLYNHLKEEYPGAFVNEDQFHLRQSFTLQTYKRRKNLNKELLSEINKLNLESLSSEDKINLRILRDYVKTFVRGHRWVMYGALNPFNNLEGIYSTDLEHLPVQIYEQISLMRKAIRLKRTNYLSSMVSVIERLQNDMNLHLSPFLSQNNSSIVQRSFQDKGILRQVQMAYEAYVELDSFLVNEYIPATRKEPGLHSMRHGIGYYKACLKFHTTSDMSPDEAHVTGLDEVERIAKQINKIKDQLNFHTDLTTFVKHVQYHTSISPDQQFLMVRDVLETVNDTLLDTVFYKLQKPKVALLPIIDGKDLSLGSYRSNVFYMNVNPAINRSSLLTIPLVLHEANPGHHFQNSYAFSRNLPRYRQNIFNTGFHTVPFSYPTYTAYIEGWALYAEYLGSEMGLYSTVYDKLGRFISEILRACRLVVDTGIHAFGWSREQGIEYIRNYTGSDQQQIENEVDMIITWPGRACAYKIGEMKIKQLRRRAKSILGPNFRLEDFHDVILRKGPVSLRILDDIVGEWIKDIVNANASNGIWTITYGCYALYANIIIIFFLS